MGQWINKLSGQDKVLDQQQRDAENQGVATREAAAKTAAANQEAAAQAGKQQELNAARQRVEEEARRAADVPPENVDVLLKAPTAEGTTQAARKKRAAFGTGYTSGVQI